MADFAAYCRNADEMAELCRKVKLRECPNCRAVGMLVLHGPLRGYSGRDEDKQVRGHRVLCSNRHLRRGCGRTFSLVFSWVLRACQATAGDAGSFLQTVRTGASRKQAWEKVAPQLSLRTGYRLWARLVSVQATVRSLLCRLLQPPSCDSPQPMCHLVDHLRLSFVGAPCPVASFQQCFQRGILRR
jgi:hypothetical protein